MIIKPNANLELCTTQYSSPAPVDEKQLHHYIQAATSDNTRKTYRSAIKQFEKWGGRLPTDRGRVVSYLLDKATTLNPRTLDLYLTAISQWHLYQGINDPVHDPLVKKTMEGIRRTHGRAKQKAKALRLEHIATMLEHLQTLPKNPKVDRDIAMVLTGFFGAFRRSELVAIRIEDLLWEPEGLIIQLPRSKTDQQGQGMLRALPFGDKTSNGCPATAIKTWLDSARLKSGPLFRPINRWGKIQEKALSPGAINDLLKSLGQACQFDFVPDLSSHSFRRGLSTSAARESVAFDLIKKQGGWKSDATVWGYIEESQQLTHNATTSLMEKLTVMISPTPS